MNVVHFANFAPHLAGIYGTARDLVIAERKQGINAQMVDYGNGLNPPQRHSRVWCKDGEIETISPNWAIEKADLAVRHSSVPQKYFNTHKPVVMPLHGAPEYTFMLEHMGQTRVLKEILVSAQHPSLKAFITFWKEVLFQWQVLLPDKKFYYVPPAVDLDFFKPQGKTFDFGKKAGKFNIVVTGIWRKEYTTPYAVLFAAAKFVQKYCSEARVHVFGIPPDNKKYPKNDGPMNRTLLALQKANLVGHCYHIVPNLDEVYRAADMCVSQHTMASRTIRESLASGCPIVAASGCRYTPYKADPKDIDGFAEAINGCYKAIQQDKQHVRTTAREMAINEFNLEGVGKAMKRIFEETLNG